jgi:diaminopimelate decarboxylase
MISSSKEKLVVFPESSEIAGDGHLRIAGCDVVALAKTYGTPLYVFDEDNIRKQCRTFIGEFKKHYENSGVLYASKACTSKAIASIMQEEGMGLDVVSGGELNIARSVKFPSKMIYFHGNNKTEKELTEALDYSIGRIVVDNFFEMEQLNRLAAVKKVKQDIMLRLSPGIDAHTHRFTTTGLVDSKFGFPIVNGQAEKAVSQAMSSANLNLIGLHCHLGSPIFETDPYALAIAAVIKFAAGMKKKYGFNMQEFSPGGGFAVQYLREKPAPPVTDYARAISDALLRAIKENGLDLPRLLVEPGRCIIARSGVALYRTGSMKDIPDVRKYVFVDGGMGDNIRPALYEAKYEALVANKGNDPEISKVTIGGKYCESGDILVWDAMLATIAAGDIIAIPVSGAYCIPMSSNYNMITRPEILILKGGAARTIRKRETYNDLK